MLPVLVILFVRMWVEIRLQRHRMNSLPRHPLREDVSWNIIRIIAYRQYSVILFVRMWVEIYKNGWLVKNKDVILFVRMWVEMTISGPASATIAVILFVRMWVEIPVLRRVGYSGKVILFVRMWVEMTNTTVKTDMRTNVILFVRMWVEMSSISHVLFHTLVILFVRMWVEISLCTDVVQDFLSSSSWGCELKCLPFYHQGKLWSHPLREDVSWNALLLTVVVLDAPVILFVRMWVEITDCFAAFKTSAGHPLREDVSWNLEEYGVNHRCSNMVLLVGRWIEISLIVFLSFARRSYYYTSFNLNIKLNYRNFKGNFYMCS